MKSSKSRSRSKQNRPRSIGNIINRVFDSSGPEGKVRGTPQQIIDKYTTLARDAQLSNDRVAAENFLQHAEHYTRMLSEAQRELAAEQDARRQGQGHQNGGGGGQPQHGQPDRSEQGQRPPREDRPAPEPRGTGAFAIGDSAEDVGLVDTPESRSSRRAAYKPQDTAPAAPAPTPTAEPAATDDQPAPPAAPTAEEPARPRRSRSPRKPRSAAPEAGDTAAPKGETPDATGTDKAAE